MEVIIMKNKKTKGKAKSKTAKNSSVATSKRIKENEDIKKNVVPNWFDDSKDKKKNDKDNIIESELKNNAIFDNSKALSKKEKKAKKASKKAEFEQKNEEALKKRGISKILATFLVELLYIMSVEIGFKLLLGNKIFDWTLFRIFLSSIIVSSIIVVLTNNLKEKMRKKLLIVFDFIVVVYAWLQKGFIDYLGTFISLGNAEQGTKITQYIIDFFSSFGLINHIIFIPFILILLYLRYEKRLVKHGFYHKINFRSFIADGLMILYFAVLSLSFYATLSLDFMQNKYQTISNETLFNYPSSPAIAIKNFGSTVYLALDIKSLFYHGEDIEISLNGNNDELKTRDIDDTLWNEIIKNEEDTSLNTLNKFFINRPLTEKNDYTGIFKDKNLIMILMESVGFPVFGEEYKEYFPTLYKLQTEGISAVNNYSPRNNCATGESEMTSEISIYSIETTCTVNTYRENVYPEALLNSFNRNGYYTSAYHDYTDQYYYRSIFEYNFGSEIFYGVDDLKMQWNYLYKEWPSDLVFMEQALPKFIDKDRFASYMITVTPHAPYKYSSEFGDMYLSMFENLEIDKNAKRYLSKIKVLDLALEYLLNSLEEKGILDDTVLVLFGDHYPYSLTDKEYASIANFDIAVNQEIDRTPFIIYNSATEPQTIEKYISPMDYTPTILNLFGIDYDPRYYFGNDIFSDYDDYVVFPDNSWQSPMGFYSTSKGEFFPNGDEEVDDKYIIETNTEINDLRNMSALAIKKNYFNYLYRVFENNGEMIKDSKENVEEIESGSSTETKKEDKK